MNKLFCKRPHGVGKKSEHSANAPTAWGRNQSTLQTSPRRGEEIGALCKRPHDVGKKSEHSASLTAQISNCKGRR